jgi:hypothetical protein
MAQGTANLRAIPGVLAEALQATLALNPSSEGQKIAQRRIEIALETALTRGGNASSQANRKPICSNGHVRSFRRSAF